MGKLIKTKLLLSATVFTFSSLAQAVVTTIDFETDASGAVFNAPNLFSSATSVSNIYSGLGVNFSALERTQVTSQVPHNGVLVTRTRNELNPSNTGMGAILNDNSGYGGPARSGDNILAFNGETDFSSHFWRISFADPIGYFGINKRQGEQPVNRGYTSFDAYDVDGNLIGSRNNEYTYSSFSLSHFKSDTEISYIDVGHELNCCGGNANAGLVSTPWALVYDDIAFGDFADAPSYTPFLSGGGTYIPVPGSIWFLLTGLLGFSGLVSKRN